MKVRFAEGHGSANIRNGDFVLIKTSERARTNPYIMVVDDVTRHSQGHVSLTPKYPAYRLLPPGVSGLALVRQDYTIVFDSNICGLHSGRRTIADYCVERGWDEHARWIGRLAMRPTQLPKMTQVSFMA